MMGREGRPTARAAARRMAAAGVLALSLGLAGPAAACPSCRLGQRVRASVVGAGFSTYAAGVVLPPVLVAGAALWLHGRGRSRGA